MTFMIKIARFILNVIYLFFKCFKRRKQITFVSRESNAITTDFKLLSERLKKELPDYKIVVLCKMMDNKFTYAFHMLKQMYHFSRSEVVILDTYCVAASMLKHKKGLKIVQIWHAIGMMKKAGYAILDKEEGRNSKITKVTNMHGNYTHVFTTSKDCIENMSKVFNCDPKIVHSVPLPRIDLLKDEKTNKEITKRIYNRYPELKKKINVLYAPTFRKNEALMKEKLDELCECFDYEKYNLLVKLHPLSKTLVNCDKAIVIDEFDTLELAHISDFIISDYSSIIYEAGILNKKLIFYAFDLDAYKGKRDLFIDYVNEVPGPVYKNAKDIINFIKKDDYSKYKDRNLISKYVDLTIKDYTGNMVNEIKKLL